MNTGITSQDFLTEAEQFKKFSVRRSVDGLDRKPGDPQAQALDEFEQQALTALQMASNALDNADQPTALLIEPASGSRCDPRLRLRAQGCEGYARRGIPRRRSRPRRPPAALSPAAGSVAIPDLPRFEHLRASSSERREAARSRPSRSATMYRGRWPNRLAGGARLGERSPAADGRISAPARIGGLPLM